ncbi:MAG TPA: putative manganese transporter [Egibacteraceae bacterium]|nr:putative manganese transporter [Egibacteraceae bacterium]
MTVWVAYLGYTWAVALTGADVSRLQSIGLLGVVAGALVGLVPGCAPQIVLTGLYVQGALPFPTLLANALSQDGAALFPLLATRDRPALLASVVTLVPALVAGSVALLVSGST